MTPEEKIQITAMENDIKEIKDQFGAVKNKLDKLYYALVGNDLTQDGGLIKRLNDNEDRMDNLEVKMNEIQRSHIKQQVIIKIFWLIAGSVGTGIITLLIGLLKK